jgi:hypothetical protein
MALHYIRVARGPGLALLLAVVAGPAVAAHGAGAAAAAPAGHGANISGLWQGNPPLDWVDPARDEMPLTPAYAAKLKEWRDAADAGQPKLDSASRCEAFGMPRFLSYGNTEILQTPGQVTMISEVMHEVRRIYTDGRKMAKDFDPGYDGYSVGHWEGKELVVHTAGIIANNNDQYGVPHSDALRVIERIHLMDANTLINIVTLIDPVAYLKPWTVTRSYHRMPAGTEFEEYICRQNYLSAK